MAKNINLNLQDALNLETIAAKYQTQLADAGITVEFMAQFRSEIETLQAVDVKQKNAVTDKKTATRTQDAAMVQCRACQNKVLNIARNAYEDNKERLKEFHVGNAYVKTVAAMLTELAYLKSVVTARLSELSAWGASETLISDIDGCIADLTAADNVQENNKNLQTAATDERGRAAKTLKNSKNRIRRAAKIVFADNADILREFEITVG